MTTFTFDNQDHTLGNMLRDELLKDEEIDFVAYKSVHPLTRKIELHVVSEDPKKDTEKAIDNLKTKINKMKSKSF